MNGLHYYYLVGEYSGDRDLALKIMEDPDLYSGSDTSSLSPKVNDADGNLVIGYGYDLHEQSVSDIKSDLAAVDIELSEEDELVINDYKNGEIGAEEASQKLSFSLSTEEQASTLLAAVIDRFEVQVTKRLEEYGVVLPQCKERAALVSLAYNGGTEGKTSLLGPALLGAIADDRRVDAWFEIRYRSNSATQDASIRRGIAKRRYFESHLFSLYDYGVGEEVDEETAREVYRMYTKNRAKILEYESQFGDGAQDSMIAWTNRDYSPESPVLGLEDSFSPAYQRLVATYVQSLDPTTGEIDFRDIHVGSDDGDLLLGTRRDGWRLIDEGAPTAAGGDQGELFLAASGRDTVHGRGGNDIIYGEDGGDLIWGGAGADWLLGGADADELYGGAGADRLHGDTGDDLLAGGEAAGVDDGAADILDGGAGFDTYYVDGGDVIVDSDGQGRVVFRGEVLHGGIEERDGSFTSHDGRFVYELAGGALTVSEVGKDGVLTIRDFNNRDLGITFSQTPAPPSVIVTGTDGHDMYQRIYGRLHKYSWDGGLFAVNGTKIETILQFEPNGFYGGEGNDVLGVGEEGSHLVTDAIQLYGEAGDDQLFSASGDDWLDGGEGHDRATGSAGRDTLLGRDGNDVLSGEEDEDLGVGGAGDDLILGGAGIDLLSGGEGNDTLYQAAEKFPDGVVGAPGGVIFRSTGGVFGDAQSSRVPLRPHGWARMRRPALDLPAALTPPPPVAWAGG